MRRYKCSLVLIFICCFLFFSGISPLLNAEKGATIMVFAGSWGGESDAKRFGCSTLIGVAHDGIVLNVMTANIITTADFTGSIVYRLKDQGVSPDEIILHDQKDNSPAVFGLAIDSKGRICAADVYENKVMQFDSTGKLLTSWDYDNGKREKSGNCLLGLSGLILSSGNIITIDSNDNLYISGIENGKIQKFNLKGKLLAVWGRKGRGKGEFNHPTAIALDDEGNIYIADTLNHRIQKLSSEGKFIAKWGRKGKGEGQFLQPQGIAVDKNGFVYVSDTGNNRIQKFDKQGKFVEMWGEKGAENGQFNEPKDLALDKDNCLYVLDSSNNRVQKFSPLEWSDIFKDCF
jgi:DNA-binding beta-propeller fold protein YncE